MNKFLFVPLLIVGLLIGCTSQVSLDPVEIDGDVESCAECNMGINEIEHATQVILEDGTPKIYDDIGCMVIDLNENDENVGIGYVHDHDSGEWIDMKEATYVQESTIHTPMNYGIIAFESADDATSFQVAHGGDIFSYDELLQLNILDLKHGDEHDHDHHGEESDSHDE